MQRISFLLLKKLKNTESVQLWTHLTDLSKLKSEKYCRLSDTRFWGADVNDDVSSDVNVNDDVNFDVTMSSMMVSIFVWQCCQWWCQFWCDNAAVQVIEFHKLNFIIFYYTSYIIYYIVFYYCQGRLPKCVQISSWWSDQPFFYYFFIIFLLLVTRVSRK